MHILNKIKEHKIEIFIFSIAFILRFAFLLFLKTTYFFYDHPSSDVLYYQEWAHEITQINFIGTKTFWGLPLYPYFLALLNRLTLGNLLAVRIIHLLLGSINCVLTYILGKNLFSKKIGLLAGILTAANFTLIFYDWLMMPVTLLIFLSLVIIHSLTKFNQIQKPHELYMLGFLIGLSILGDGKMLIFITLFFFYLFFLKRKRDIPHYIKQGLIIALGIFTLLGLTMLRNKHISGDYIFISAQSGLSFFVGNNENATGYFQNPPFIRPTHQGQDQDQIIVAEQLSGKKLSDKEVSSFWKNKGITFIKSNPKKYLALLLKKIRLFISTDENSFDIDLLLVKSLTPFFDFNPYSLIFPLALIGILFSFKEISLGKIQLNLIIFSQFLITLIFFLTNRHRATILPLLIIYESEAIVWIYHVLKRKQYVLLVFVLSALISFILVNRGKTFGQQELSFLTHSKKGPIYEKNRNFIEAKKHYLAALNIHPNDTNTLFNLGNTYFLEGNYILAIETYKKTLQVNPLHIDALFNLGYTYQTINKPDKAITLYKKLLDLDPQCISAHYQLGKIYQKQGQCVQSEKHLKTILKITPIYTNEINQLLTSCKNLL